MEDCHSDPHIDTFGNRHDYRCRIVYGIIECRERFGIICFLEIA